MILLLRKLSYTGNIFYLVTQGSLSINSRFSASPFANFERCVSNLHIPKRQRLLAVVAPPSTTLTNKRTLSTFAHA